MSKSSVDSALLELGNVIEPYSIAIELIASSASRSIDKFAENKDESSRRDAILTGFIVGLTLVEHSILSGYNAQAAALVRQELEAVAALEELRLGLRKEGKTPNIRYVPSVPGAVYSDLSKATHFSDTPTLRLLCRYYGTVPNAPNNTEMWLLSPQHIPNTTKQLFVLHTLLLLHFIEHQFEHYSVLHNFEPTEDDVAKFDRAVDLLNRSGMLETT